jgi:hypothetical protein
MAMFAQPLAVLLAVKAGPAPNAGCPSADAITAELKRLGTAAALAAVGSLEVTVQGTRMQVTLRGLDGTATGVREVTAPASCAERARVAAVLISAWAGTFGVVTFPASARPPSAPRSLSRSEDASESPNAATAASGRRASEALGSPAEGTAPASVASADLELPAAAAGHAETPPPPAGPAIASPGAMRLTETQLADLKSAGARLDAEDMEMADRLGRKGFVGDDLVAAYRERNAMRAVHPELASRGSAMVETIAVAQKLGLDEKDTYWLVRNRDRQDKTLIRAHTKKVPSGRGMVGFGGVMTGIGIVLLAVGLPMSSDETYDNGKYQNVPSAWGYAGKMMEIMGGVSVAAGFSITLFGLYRWTVPPADDASDSRGGNKGQALRTSASAQRRSATRWALSPSLGPHQAGFGLTTAF